MKKYRLIIGLAVCLLLCSVSLYVTDYLIYGDRKAVLTSLLLNMAFLPIYVLIVVLVIEQVTSGREKQAMLYKLNMIIGLFFTEMGTQLLGSLTVCLENREALRRILSVRKDWTSREFREALSAAESFAYQINMEGADLRALRQMLVSKRDLLLLLLANPNLLEHERFTDLLWAVSHLLEELSSRESLDHLPQNDKNHLAGDIKRVYSQLTVEWLLYCRHLQEAYPYIFSIVVRTHPLQDHPCAMVA